MTATPCEPCPEAMRLAGDPRFLDNVARQFRARNRRYTPDESRSLAAACLLGAARRAPIRFDRFDPSKVRGGADGYAAVAVIRAMREVDAEERRYREKQGVSLPPELFPSPEAKPSFDEGMDVETRARVAELRDRCRDVLAAHPASTSAASALVLAELALQNRDLVPVIRYMGLNDVASDALSAWIVRLTERRNHPMNTPKFVLTPPPVPNPVSPTNDPALTQRLLGSLDALEPAVVAAPPASVSDASEESPVPKQETSEPKAAKPKAAKPKAAKPKAEPKPKAEKKAAKPKAEPKPKTAKPKAEPKAKKSKAKVAVEKAKVAKDKIEATATEATLTSSTTPFGIERSVPLDRIVKVDECETIRTTAAPDVDETLLASVKTLGVLVPLLVEHDEKSNTFRLLDGHRRFAAATAAKLDEVPVRIVNAGSHRKAVGKMVGRENVKDSDVRHVLGVVANTARRDLDEADFARSLRKLCKLDGGTNLTDKDGNPNVKAVSRVLGTGYSWTRSRLTVLSTYSDEEIGRLDAAVVASADAKTETPFSWSFVQEVLTKPKKYAAFRPVVDGLAKGTNTLADLDAVGSATPEAGGDGGGEGTEPAGNEGGSKTVKVGAAYFASADMTVALVGAPRVATKMVVSFTLDLGETAPNLTLNGAHGKRLLGSVVGMIQKQAANVLTGDPTKGADEITRVTTEVVAMISEGRDALISKLKS